MPEDIQKSEWTTPVLVDLDQSSESVEFSFGPFTDDPTLAAFTS